MNLEELKMQIRRVEADGVEELMDAVFARKRELFPDWDIVYIALPKNNWKERRRTLEMVLKMEERFQKES